MQLRDTSKEHCEAHISIRSASSYPECRSHGRSRATGGRHEASYATVKPSALKHACVQSGFEQSTFDQCLRTLQRPVPGKSYLMSFDELRAFGLAVHYNTFVPGLDQNSQRCEESICKSSDTTKEMSKENLPTFLVSGHEQQIFLPDFPNTT